MVRDDYKNIIRKYPEQGYFTFFNKKTGFFARVEENGHKLPFWSKHGPELIDISITNWCDRGCSFCYRNSNKNGKFMTLENLDLILQQALRINVYQIALGGGNPNQHPNFNQILKLIRKKYQIVPTYTTNGRGLSNAIVEATKRYCGAVAVSAYTPYDEMQNAINIFTNNQIKTNLHFLLTNKSIKIAIDWLKKPPDILKKINALVFLNYKPLGNHSSSDLLLSQSNKIKDFFYLLSTKKFSFRIGFDSCSISGIVKYLDINPIFIDFCEAGRFSCFISEEMKMYPCSFMESISDGVDLFKYNIIDAWINNSIFKNIRKKIEKTRCINCEYNNSCYGGCPIFKDINLC